MEQETTSEKIVKLLKINRLTKQNLCRELGISMNGFKRMLDNDRFKRPMLERLCIIFNVELDYLIGSEQFTFIKEAPSTTTTTLPQKPFEKSDKGDVVYYETVIKELSNEVTKWRLRAYSAEARLGKPLGEPFLALVA